MSILGEFYEFRPSANDADGDKLNFSIDWKPDWAKSDHEYGGLWGTRDASHVGVFWDIKPGSPTGKTSRSSSHSASP
jgi:hypothetical protein